MSLKQHLLPLQSSWNRIFRLSSWSHVVAIGSIAILFAACDDDSGSSVYPENEAELVEISSSSKETSSSSIEKSKSSSSVDKVSSSSSKRTASYSSVVQGDAKQSSSSKAAVKSSSSIGTSSSSIVKPQSSSSEAITPSSSSFGEKSSSSENSVKTSSSIGSSSSSIVKPQSSSSEAITPSISSVGEKSSSSETVVKSSNSVSGVSSSSLVISDGWSWDVPKEARLNPDVDYGTMVDSRDGKKYKTVTIGDQTWMAENLNYADSAKTASLKGKSWCFGNDSLKCNVAGRLYTWAAAIDSVKFATDADNPQDCGFGKTCTLPAKVQGICPTGWHLPSYNEWNALFTAAGGQSTAATALKSQTGWNNNGNGTDAFGFSALPAGNRHDNGDYYGGGYNTYFWSSTEYGSNDAYDMYLNYNNGNAGLGLNYKYNGFSVRCVKD